MWQTCDGKMYKRPCPTNIAIAAPFQDKNPWDGKNLFYRHFIDASMNVNDCLSGALKTVSEIIEWSLKLL